MTAKDSIILFRGFYLGYKARQNRKSMTEGWIWAKKVIADAEQEAKKEYNSFVLQSKDYE